MSTRVGTSGVSREDLALHFDGELTGAEAHELAAQIEADPELRDELAQLGVLRGLVSETLSAKAEQVPQARFEQIWSEIDRTLDRDAREAAATDADQASIWSRVWSAIKPLRIPLAVAGAAAAIALVVANSGPTGANTSPADANNPGSIASSQKPAAEQPSESIATPKPAPKADPGRLAQATPEPQPEPADDMPKPKKVEAEIHGVDFSGHTGRISRTGTVTVLYLEEEAEPKDSERSL